MSDILVAQIVSVVSLVLSGLTFLYAIVRMHLFLNSATFADIEQGVRLKNTDDSDIKARLTSMKESVKSAGDTARNAENKVNRLVVRFDSHLKSGKK